MGWFNIYYYDFAKQLHNLIDYQNDKMLYRLLKVINKNDIDINHVVDGLTDFDKIYIIKLAVGCKRIRNSKFFVQLLESCKRNNDSIVTILVDSILDFYPFKHLN